MGIPCHDIYAECMNIMTGDFVMCLAKHYWKCRKNTIDIEY